VYRCGQCVFWLKDAAVSHNLEQPHLTQPAYGWTHAYTTLPMLTRCSVGIPGRGLGTSVNSGSKV
jgi:hypothetical protein